MQEHHDQYVKLYAGVDTTKVGPYHFPQSSILTGCGYLRWLAATVATGKRETMEDIGGKDVHHIARKYYPRATKAMSASLLCKFGALNNSWSGHESALTSE